jgi:transcriptional regulator with XRE-family HTH domain
LSAGRYFGLTRFSISTRTLSIRPDSGSATGKEKLEVVEIAIATVPRRIDPVGAIDKVDTTTMGGRMTWARLRKGMTQAELAKSLGKSRASVVQYEQGNILPPLDVVSEVAERLGVTPGFIAFNEHAVPGLNRADVQTLAFPENKVGKDGIYATSVFSFDQKLVADYGVEEQDAFAAFVLGHEAPEFGLRSGDRIFADTSVKGPVSGRDLYLIRTAQGMEIVRVEPSLSSRADTNLNMTGPKGQSLKGKLSDLEFIGAVVATLRRQ